MALADETKTAKAPLVLASAVEERLEAGINTNIHSPQRHGLMRQLSEGGANSMEWTDLNFGVRGKEILRNVSGAVRSGEMACILGPSGAGKSSLLNILAGRMKTTGNGNTFSGDVSMNGHLVEPLKVRSKIAYVMQEDALPAMSTPRELLHMSAVLRLNATLDDVNTQVSDLLEGLRLEKCADTFVGSTLVRGISGGEKKRTAVAVELITQPRMIFLDEPLSGLDSYAAWTVVQVLKDLAQNGCAVLCTVHQPSSEIFTCFDKLMCLAEGRVAYCGGVQQLTSYMEQVGKPVPTHFNPADHILFQVQTLSLNKEELERFCNVWSEKEKDLVLPGIHQSRQRGRDSGAVIAPVWRKSFFVQLSFLISREVKGTFRDKINLIARFLVNAVMGGLFACIFFNIGDKSGPQGIQSHFGAICNIMIGTMFGSSQPLLLQFPSERPVFLREYAANMYGTVPYFLAKMVVELPLTFLTCAEMMAISYPVMGLQGNPILLVLISWALAVTAASTALLIGCNVAQAQRAQEFAPLIFVPQIIFSGIFITISLIPKWMRWLQYACALKYAINLGTIVELGSQNEYFLNVMDIYSDQWHVYLGILLAILVGFRILAMIGLRRSAKFVY